MSHSRDLGAVAFKRKDYRKAIELFDRAIGQTPSAQLYDYRAACNEKLNDLPTALKDAKKAVQAFKEDPTGYLRAGRILVKMDKKSVAAEVYSAGLKRVKRVGRGYAALRQAHDDLQSELSPHNSVDPLTVLPRELAEQVLQYLSFRQLIKSCLVSKGWTDFIRSCPDLWSHLDLGGARRKVKNSFISRAINTARSKLRNATLDNLFDFDKALTAVVRNCPLEELKLLRTGRQGQNLALILQHAKMLKSLDIQEATDVGDNTLAEILLSGAARLEVIRCDKHTEIARPIFREASFPRLRELEICLRLRSDFADLRLPISGVTTLTSLHLWISIDDAVDRVLTWDFRIFPHLRYLHVDGVHRHGPAGFKLPQTLTVLRLETAPGGTHPTFGFDRWSLPRLEKLILGDTRIVQAHALEDMMTLRQLTDGPSISEQGEPSKIHTISFSTFKLPIEWKAQFSEFLKHPRLSQLHHLGLPKAMDFDDEWMSIITQCQPGLQSLDLSQTNITGVGVKATVDLGHLKELEVEGCQKLSPDAVKWARSKGVRVRYSQTLKGWG